MSNTPTVLPDLRRVCEYRIEGSDIAEALGRAAVWLRGRVNEAGKPNVVTLAYNPMEEGALYIYLSEPMLDAPREWRAG